MPPYPPGPDLVGMGAVLWRRRWVFVVVLLLCAGAGLAVGLLREPDYTFRAVLQSGTLDALHGNKPMLSAPTVAGQIRNFYAPATLARSASEGHALARKLKIDVNAGTNDHVISISAAAPLADADEAASLLKEVATSASRSVNEKLSEYVAANRKYLKNQIAGVESRIEKLNDQVAHLDRGGGENAAAATYVAVQVSQLENSLADYRQQLNLLPVAVRQAGLVGSVTRSLHPSTPGWSLLTALGGVCGFVLGLLAVAFVELGIRIRRRLPADG